MLDKRDISLVSYNILYVNITCKSRKDLDVFHEKIGLPRTFTNILEDKTQ